MARQFAGAEKLTPVVSKNHDRGVTLLPHSLGGRSLGCTYKEGRSLMVITINGGEPAYTQ